MIAALTPMPTYRTYQNYHSYPQRYTLASLQLIDRSKI